MLRIPLSTNKKRLDFKLTKFNVMPMKSINFSSKNVWELEGTKTWV